MNGVRTDPDPDMINVMKNMTDTVWIYKSTGGWNNKEIIFMDNGKVYMEDEEMGYWGV